MGRREFHDVSAALAGLLLGGLLAAAGIDGASAAEAPRSAGAVDDVRIADAPQAPQNWMTHGGPYPEWYYSPLAAITPQNVGDLRPAWSLELDTNRGQEATPIVVDGVMYVTTAWSKLYAIDAKTGRQLWRFDPKVPGSEGYKTCCDVVNRGAAVYKGRVFIGTVDGRLIALDAASGKRLWSARTVDPKQDYSITGAPRVFRDKVLIGNAGGDFGVRGYVSAYSVDTGNLVWRFYTVPGDPGDKPDRAASDDALATIAAPTWRGRKPVTYGAGGTVWNAMVYDAKYHQVYIGVGNPYPWNPKFRADGKGDTLFASSIVAVDADTGRYVWHYQEVPSDAWDFDATADMILTQQTVGGRERDVLMHAPKDGYFYVIDRKSGELVSADPFVPGISWANGHDASGRPKVDPRADYQNGPTDVSPTPAGAHEWQAAAFSPKTGYVYIPTTEGKLHFVSSERFDWRAGVGDIGIQMGPTEPSPPPPPGTKPAPIPSMYTAEYLLAWDPINKRAAWRTPTHNAGGALATGGNLVFQGQHRDGMVGEFRAYRADTGEVIWKYPVPNAIIANPISYSVDGEQYVAVISGAGGSEDIHTIASGPIRVRSNGRMLAFRLGGTATLPPDPPYAAPIKAPPNTWSMEQLRRGGRVYGDICARCHGPIARSWNVIPDLRRSPALQDAALWRSIVIDGVLRDAGMMSWARLVSGEDAEAVRGYVANEARNSPPDVPQ